MEREVHPELLIISQLYQNSVSVMLNQKEMKEQMQTPADLYTVFSEHSIPGSQGGP